MLQGLRALCTRLETALADAAASGQLSRTGSRRLSRGTSGVGASRSSQQRRSLGSPSSSMKQSRKDYDASLTAEHSAKSLGRQNRDSSVIYLLMYGNVCV